MTSTIGCNATANPQQVDLLAAFDLLYNISTCRDASLYSPKKIVYISTRMMGASTSDSHYELRRYDNRHDTQSVIRLDSKLNNKLIVCELHNESSRIFQLLFAH